MLWLLLLRWNGSAHRVDALVVVASMEWFRSSRRCSGYCCFDGMVPRALVVVALDGMVPFSLVIVSSMEWFCTVVAGVWAKAF